jgi:hypothetical protein
MATAIGTPRCPPGRADHGHADPCRCPRRPRGRRRRRRRVRVVPSRRRDVLHVTSRRARSAASRGANSESATRRLTCRTFLPAARSSGRRPTATSTRTRTAASIPPGSSRAGRSTTRRRCSASQGSRTSPSTPAATSPGRACPPRILLAGRDPGSARARPDRGRRRGRLTCRRHLRRLRTRRLRARSAYAPAAGRDPVRHDHWARPRDCGRVRDSGLRNGPGSRTHLDGDAAEWLRGDDDHRPGPVLTTPGFPRCG